ncbi:MAG: exonuclease domain-containing protein [Candidatus Omnitrophica bacterium]|nr:exonuclease domain-containing protein [Candidatus Omnitrophota bacterium]
MDLTKNIDDVDLVFLDLETTGLDVIEGDAICEIGALKTRGRKISDRFQTLINPGKHIPHEVFLIHKISDDDVKDAPHFRDIVESLKAFINDCVVCAYNAEFDIGFITHESRRIQYQLSEIPALDILSMARKTIKLPGYKLDYTARYFNVDYSTGFHRAMNDAFIAFQVFYKLRDILRSRNFDILGEYLSLFGVNNAVFRLKEEPKIIAIKEAITKGINLKIRYFSYENTMEEEEVKPINFFQEHKHFYLWCQNLKNKSFRINVNRIFEIEIV